MEIFVILLYIVIFLYYYPFSFSLYPVAFNIKIF